MTDTLLWIIFLELTLMGVLGGYVLYEIQTALAIIALHDCVERLETPPVAVVDEPLILGPTPIVVDDQDSIGTFTGAAWR